MAFGRQCTYAHTQKLWLLGKWSLVATSQTWKGLCSKQSKHPKHTSATFLTLPSVRNTAIDWSCYYTPTYINIFESLSWIRFIQKLTATERNSQTAQKLNHNPLIFEEANQRVQLCLSAVQWQIDIFLLEFLITIPMAARSLGSRVMCTFLFIKLLPSEPI